MSFAAHYAGVCAICQEAFFEGDEIESVEGEYAHADCAAEWQEEE